MLPVRLRTGGLGLPSVSAAAAKLRPFRAKLPIPEVLTGAQLEIEMREAKVAVLPGRKTKMWTYGGSFPGPTIRRPAGRQPRSPSSTGCRGRRVSSPSTCTGATTAPSTTDSRAV